MLGNRDHDDDDDEEDYDDGDHNDDVVADQEDQEGRDDTWQKHEIAGNYLGKIMLAIVST